MLINNQGATAAALQAADVKLPAQFNLDDGRVARLTEEAAQANPQLDRVAHEHIGIIGAAKELVIELAERAKQAAKNAEALVIDEGEAILGEAKKLAHEVKDAIVGESETPVPVAEPVTVVHEDPASTTVTAPIAAPEAPVAAPEPFSEPQVDESNQPTPDHAAAPQGE